MMINLLWNVDMESTYTEYSDWTDAGVPETVTQHYKRALQQLESRRPYEEALVLHAPPHIPHSGGKKGKLSTMLKCSRVCASPCAVVGVRATEAGRVSELHWVRDEGGRPCSSANHIWESTGRELFSSRPLGQIHHLSGKW